MNKYTFNWNIRGNPTPKSTEIQALDDTAAVTKARRHLQNLHGGAAESIVLAPTLRKSNGEKVPFSLKENGS